MTGYIKPNLSNWYQMLFFPHSRAREKSSVVYHLLYYLVNLSILGLAKCMENSRLNFVPESRLPSLPFAQISSINRKTAAKAWNRCQNRTRISVWSFPSGKKQNHLFSCSIASGNLPQERPKKSCPIYFSTRFFVWKMVNSLWLFLSGRGGGEGQGRGRVPGKTGKCWWM